MLGLMGTPSGVAGASHLVRRGGKPKEKQQRGTKAFFSEVHSEFVAYKVRFGNDIKVSLKMVPILN